MISLDISGYSTCLYFDYTGVIRVSSDSVTRKPNVTRLLRFVEVPFLLSPLHTREFFRSKSDTAGTGSEEFAESVHDLQEGRKFRSRKESQLEFTYSITW